VGARFRGHVKRNGRGPTYWTSCSVTECDPDRVFAFGVGAPGKAMNTWSYRLEPAPGGGTDVTESFQLSDVLPLKLYRTLFGWTRGRTNREGMRTTLERIKAEVETD
jgi:hypothetical protein